MNQIQKVKNQVSVSKVVSVWDYFEKRKGDISKVLPKHITIDRLIGVMTYAIKSTPAIMQASQASLIAAVIQTVQLGLEPGNMGHCYYVPFNNRKADGSVVKEVQFILGVKGIIELVNRAGKAVVLSSECVYSNDKFEYAQGLEPMLRHIPANGERGEFVAVYAIAKNLVAGEKVFVVLTKEEVEKVKGASKAAGSQYSPWNTWFDQMAQKTAIKRLCKLLPLSVQVQKQVSTDETTKSKINEDMTIVPDETNWNESIVDVTPAVEMTPEAPGLPQTEEVPLPIQAPDKTENVGPSVNSGEFKPSSSDLKNTPENVMRQEIATMIGLLCKGNESLTPQMLQGFTSFNDFAGYSNIHDIKATSKTGKRTQLEVTHSKIKKEYLESLNDSVEDINVEER